MARSIFRSHNSYRRKYGNHICDQFYYISRSKKKRNTTKKYKNKYLYTAYVQLSEYLAYKYLQMSENALKKYKLKKLNYKYLSNNDASKLEEMILDLLPKIRKDIETMMDSKGDTVNVGYTKLILANRIIAAKSCYEKAYGERRYFYGTVKHTALTDSENDNKSFLMSSSDNETEWSEKKRTN
eukprot:159026_1